MNEEKIDSIIAEPFNKPSNTIEQIDALLLYIEKISPYVSAAIFIFLPSEYPIVYAKNEEELGGVMQFTRRITIY